MSETDEALPFDVERRPVMDGAAKFSDDGRYRYALSRRWAPRGQVATFIMLNPSTADAEMDDPTIRRCIGFARSWGMAALHVLNLYAFRATLPSDLWRAADPVGPDNDEYLAWHADTAARTGSPIVAAWGQNARRDRVEDVLAMPGMSRALTCLGVTKSGDPRHPLYLRSDTPRRPWRPTW